MRNRAGVHSVGFCVITPSSLVRVYKRFEGTWCLHLLALIWFPSSCLKAVGSTFLQNVRSHLPDCREAAPTRKQHASWRLSISGMRHRRVSWRISYLTWTLSITGCRCVTPCSVVQILNYHLNIGDYCIWVDGSSGLFRNVGSYLRLHYLTPRR